MLDIRAKSLFFFTVTDKLVRDTGYGIRDTGQIMDDLIPMRRQDGGVLIGNTGCLVWDVINLVNIGSK